MELLLHLDKRKQTPATLNEMHLGKLKIFALNIKNENKNRAKLNFDFKEYLTILV